MGTPSAPSPPCLHAAADINIPSSPVFLPRTAPLPFPSHLVPPSPLPPQPPPAHTLHPHACSCAKCAKYTDKTIGQCKFWTFDGVGTCWLKSTDQGYKKSCAKCTCGGVSGWAPPAPPPPPPAPPTPLPTPPEPTPTKWDGKPVQVYIMMGQSNMLGEGTILGAQNNTLQSAVFNQGKYPWLKNGSTWSIAPKTRNVFIMGSGNATFATSALQHNEWLTPDYGDKSEGEVRVGGAHKTLGPEFGIANFGGSFKQVIPNREELNVVCVVVGVIVRVVEVTREEERRRV